MANHFNGRKKNQGGQNDINQKSKDCKNKTRKESLLEKGKKRLLEKTNNINKGEEETDNRENAQEEEVVRLEKEELLRQDREQRVKKKNKLNSQIQLSLGSGTGILAVWKQIQTAVTTGNVPLFESYAPIFVKKVKAMNEIVKQYDEIVSISSDPKEDLLTISLNSELESRELVVQVNEIMEKLEVSGFLCKREIDPEQLLEWYRKVIN